MDDIHDSRSTLGDQLHVVGRRKWTVLAAVVLTPLIAVALSLVQEPRYRATAEVLLTQGNVAALLDRELDPGRQEASRLALTQARLARVPVVVERTLEEAEVRMTVRDFLFASDVVAVRDTDIVEFRVTDGDPARAARLASAYAEQFTIYRRELDTMSIRRARSEVQEQISELEATGGRRTPLYNTLVEKDQQLATIEALQTSNAFVVQRAGSARQTQPKPVRNGLMGLGLGLFLGLVLALLRDALDTRVRSAEEVGVALELPLLARLPPPPKKLRSSDRPVMLAEPNAPAAEAFRMLRANLEFVTLDHEVKSIVVTSAISGEGKSTTCANLAAALAAGGKRVIVVDLDLRRPSLHRLFRVASEGPGLTNVVLGHAALEEAMWRIAIARVGRKGGAPTNGRDGNVGGTLDLLLPGPLPPNVGEFVGSDAIAGVLSELHARADVVLIDAPPLLQVGDVMSLRRSVDGALIVARPSMLRKGTLTELRRVSSAMGIHLLGYVVTDADVKGQYGYGYGYEPVVQSRSRRREPARTLKG